MQRFLTWCVGVAVAGLTSGIPAQAAAQDHHAAAPPAGAVSTTTGGPNAADSSAPSASPQTAPTSPLAIHVGDADLLIGGFMDMIAVTRSTATGNGLGTNFGGFPFATTTTGAANPNAKLSETRLSAQNSRVTLQATSKWGDASVKGYLEADFLGNTAQNLNVTSNSNGLRMRLYWVQLQTGKFEFLAGQSWSMLVPSRNGISPMPGDLFYSQDIDTNYQMGLTWQRVPGVRFIAHASKTVTAGIALENPEQYVGGAVVLPKGFQAFEVDSGSGGSAVGSSSPTPNLYPDITGKIAIDPITGQTHQHIDAAVMVNGYRTYNPGTDSHFSKTGFSGSVNVVLQPVKRVSLVATNFFSNGGGRQIANTNIPDFIVDPDYSLSLVKSFSGIYGAEITQKNSLVYGYYSLARADRTVTFDADGVTVIGYGVNGSQSANHKMNETTVGLTQTIFKDPKIGGMQLMFQFSHLQRTPFAVPAGTPASAKLNMFYANIRYILP